MVVSEGVGGGVFRQRVGMSVGEIFDLPRQPGLRDTEQWALNGRRNMVIIARDWWGTWIKTAQAAYQSEEQHQEITASVAALEGARTSLDEALSDAPRGDAPHPQLSDAYHHWRECAITLMPALERALGADHG